MRARSRKMSVALGVAVTAGLGGLAREAKAASYTVSNSFLLPTSSNIFTYSDGVPTSGLNANYSSFGVSTSASNPAYPQVGSQGGSPGIIGVLFGTGANTSNAGLSIATAYAYDSVGFHTVGLYTPTSTGYYGTGVSVRAINAAGQVIGTSAANSVYNSSNQVLGTTAWLNNDTGPAVAIGLSSGNNGYTVTLDNASTPHTGIFSYNTAAEISSMGYVAGTASRYAGNGASVPGTLIGTSSWVFAPSSANSTTGTNTEVGLFNALSTYSYTSAGTQNEPDYNMYVSAVNNNGAVVGSATPYSTVTNGNNGYSLGNDLYIYIPGTSPANVAIGAFNFTSGSVANFATTTISVTDPYNDTTSSQATPASISLSETIPSPTITPASGAFPSSTTFAYGRIVLGTSRVLGSNTIYTPTYYGSSSDPVANIVSRSSSVVAMNDNNQVAFTSNYYINNGATGGTDSFIYTPGVATPYVQVGLTTDAFAANATSGYPVGSTSFVTPTGSRSSSVAFMNSTGQSSGTSNAYVIFASTSYYSSTAAWFASASGATVQIGLFNTSVGVHTTSPQGGYSETVTGMNNSGLVAGYSSRYSPGTANTNGQDAWVYDPNNISPLTGTHTWLVDPTDAANSSVYTKSTIDYLSDTGYAVGDIQTTASAPYQNEGFIWSEQYGLQLLANTLPSNLSGTAYQDIINAYYADSGGDTIYATASSTGFSGTVSVYSPVYSSTTYLPSALETLTGSPVPEPASLSLLTMGGVFLLGRRRRRSV